MVDQSSGGDDQPCRTKSEEEDGANRKTKAFLSGLSAVLKFILAQWLVIGFGLSCLLAYFFPSKPHSDDYFVHARIQPRDLHKPANFPRL